MRSTLVRHETSSDDLPGLTAGLDLLRELAVHRLGRPDHAWNRPPTTLNAASAPLLDLAREVAREQGRDDLPDAAAGDANFVAALGLPVLCGMGAVGDGAHTQGEFIHPGTVPAQTALVAGLLGRLAQPLRG